METPQERLGLAIISYDEILQWLGLDHHHKVKIVDANSDIYNVINRRVFVIIEGPKMPLHPDGAACEVVRRPHEHKNLEWKS